jgi:MFS family permease
MAVSQVIKRRLTDSAPELRFERSNVVRLAIAQALGGANSAIIYATGAVVGDMLASSKALATLPISIFVVGMAACTLPAGVMTQRFGRRTTFMIGTGCGVLAGLVASWAILFASFWLFCASAFLGGIYAAVVLSFRFAATDSAAPERRPRALSAVMAGGVFAGVIGPQIVTYTMDLWQPYLFVATYLAQAGLAALSLLVLIGVRLPIPTAADTEGGRPLSVIARQPRFVGAVVCGVVSYLLMNFLMTAAPLAMKFCKLSQEFANLGMQWHVIAMYAPSFWTGWLIIRFGAPKVVATGMVLIAASSAIGLLGVEITYFWTTLILLGAGWNFGFVGASAMVLECHRPEEKARVQSLNDFIVFGAMAFGSFVSGGLHSVYGWNTILWISFMPLIVAVAALVLAFPRPIRADAAS